MLTLTLCKAICSCVEDEEEDVDAMLACSKYAYSLVKPSSVELVALVTHGGEDQLCGVASREWLLPHL